MPSGKTHDRVTFLLALPTFALAWRVTGNPMLAALVTGAMLWGGLMFGPDLDTQSRQYARWSVFRFLWFPYRVVFRHRSRWSHGIIFSTLIRVLYFAGILTLIFTAAVYLRTVFMGGGTPPSLQMIIGEWQTLASYIETYIGRHGVWAMLVGLWWGAASHTLIDIGWSILRKASQLF